MGRGLSEQQRFALGIAYQDGGTLHYPLVVHYFHREPFTRNSQSGCFKDTATVKAAKASTSRMIRRLRERGLIDERNSLTDKGAKLAQTFEPLEIPGLDKAASFVTAPCTGNRFQEFWGDAKRIKARFNP